MNYENYDPKFISNSEVIGAYFLNTFYNDLYIKAHQSLASGKYTSRTDAYRGMVTNYIYGIETPELCNKVIQGLHKYYQDKTNYSVITLSEFESKVLSQFIPSEYFRDFTGRDKDSNLCAIIRRTVNMFGNKLLEKKYLSMIIDNRKINANIRILQDLLLNILITQREEYYTNFARKITQKSTNTVSDEVMDKLRTALIDMTRKKCAVERERDNAINILRQVALKVRELENNSTARLPAAKDATNANAISDTGTFGNAATFGGVNTYGNAATFGSVNTNKSVLTAMSTLHPDNILNTPTRRPIKADKPLKVDKSVTLTEDEIKQTLGELSAPVIKLTKEPEFMQLQSNTAANTHDASDTFIDDDDDSEDDITAQHAMIMNRFKAASHKKISGVSAPALPTSHKHEDLHDEW